MSAPLIASEEVHVQVEFLLGEQIVCQETHDNVRDLNKYTESYFWISTKICTHNPNDADDCSEGHISLTRNTIAHLVGGDDGPEADHSGQHHLRVSAEEPKQQREEEGEDASVCVAFLEEENQGQLAKHDHKHEVTAEHAET